jgi:hypothetical protein
LIPRRLACKELTGRPSCGLSWILGIDESEVDSNAIAWAQSVEAWEKAAASFESGNEDDAA